MITSDAIAVMLLANARKVNARFVSTCYVSIANE